MQTKDSPFDRFDKASDKVSHKVPTKAADKGGESYLLASAALLEYAKLTGLAIPPVECDKNGAWSLMTPDR